MKVLLRFHVTPPHDGKKFQAVIAETDDGVVVMTNRGKGRDWVVDDDLNAADLMMPEHDLNEWDIEEVDEPAVEEEEVGKFNPNHRPGGDEHGGEFAPRGAYEFVSPNVGNLDFEGAIEETNGNRHRKISDMTKDIDHDLGLNSETKTVIGAWRDGAENSTMTELSGATWADLRDSAALKGYLANQKQSLIFQEVDGGKDMLATFEAKGSLDSIHKHLLDNGLEFHTLEPTSVGARVHVFGSDEATAHAVNKAGEHYGSKIDAKLGVGEFIGTTKDTGTDAAQRADARRAYARILDESGNGRSKAIWARIRDRRREADAIKRQVREYASKFSWEDDDVIVDD